MTPQYTPLLFFFFLVDSALFQIIVELLPLGRYPFLSEPLPPAVSLAVPSVLSPAVATIDQSDPVISRKLMDNTSPADTAYVWKCIGTVSKAALNCPCAAPGRQCAPDASICNLNYRCVCDSRLGFADATGTKCVRYSTPTTPSTPPPMTCPTYTCPTLTCPTTPTTTTTASTTTTTGTTTTAAPDNRCATAGVAATYNGSTVTACGTCTVLTKGIPTNLNAMIDAGGSSSYTAVCLWHFEAPAGSSLKIDALSQSQIECNRAMLVINGVAYCGSASGEHTPLPPTQTLSASSTTIAYLRFAASGAQAGYDMTITAV